MTDNIIEVRDLCVEFPLKKGILHAVQHVNFDIPRGEITALVGESGSGKSTLASGILNVVSTPGRISEGKVFYNGDNVLDYNKEQIIKYRWKEVSMVFQAAQNALNPVMTIKDQMIETAKAHESEMSEKKIIDKASELLEFVRLEPQRVLNSYPHELSGGMKQRVMIAFSLLLDPQLVILDEPTTALDVITQDYIFDILDQIHKEMKVTMLLLTHDMGVVAKVADRIGVMYAGNIMEIGDVYSIFENPSHPYTNNLIHSAPSLVGEIKEKKSLIGAPPDLFDLPSGCPFFNRCDRAIDICDRVKPQSIKQQSGNIVACHLVR